MALGNRAAGSATTRDRIILALDVSSLADALSLVKATRESVGMYKVGMELFYSVGIPGLRAVMSEGVSVFLDLKLHDIPTTVERASRVLAATGVAMLNVHCLGGLRMMKAAADAVGSLQDGSARHAKVIGVTVLTSLSQDEVTSELGIERPLVDQVTALALNAKKAGLDGVVASPWEVSSIRKACGDGFAIVTPGVRPRWAGVDDQRRVTTPGEAIRSGADYVVVGRAVTRDKDPRSAAARVLTDIEAELGECEC
ncbi:MAG: orotidine-5'-phosphate decarboxylase [Firmicutes bacterium]|nr:orotidine-5'-phosphate decarboxylase [Bacillota bacterium]